MPALTVPSFSLMSELISQSLIIAIVAFAINVSLVKSFAKKNNYETDANQVGVFVWICQVLNAMLNARIEFVANLHAFCDKLWIF